MASECHDVHIEYHENPFIDSEGIGGGGGYSHSRT
jgi:hypothetical protein